MARDPIPLWPTRLLSLTTLFFLSSLRSSLASVHLASTPPPTPQLMQLSLARLLQPTETVAGTPECVSECQVWQSQPNSASLMDPGFNLGGAKMCVGVCGRA